MDVDHPMELDERINALAGPSSQPGPSTLPDVPDVYRPPAPARSLRKPLFDSTHDLISRFQLLPSYDKYVRPYVHPSTNDEPLAKLTPGGAPTPGGPFQAPTPSAFDKGKGREITAETPRMPMGASTPADGGDGGDGDDEEGGKGEKKKKNTYRHLIRGLPGKHSTKKDDYLQSIIQVPPKQKMSIVPFDQRTQREAFSVSLEGLKGWNISALVLESPQAREDRKKRKELKKLQKAQQAQVLAAGSALPSATTIHAAGAATHLGGSAVATVSKPGPTPSHRIPPTPSATVIGTPRPGAVPQRNGSRPPGPGPGSRVARAGTPGVSTPKNAATMAPSRPGSAEALALRGKKREYEDDIPLALAQQQKRALAAQQPSSGAVGGLKVGADASRPRPAKKPRTDTTPHGSMGLPGLQREVPQQQPTPQGV